MQHVSSICHKFNYGLHGSSADEGAFTPLIQLGFSMHLCCHQHRNARAASSRARLIWQKYYIVVVDWVALAKLRGSRSGGSTTTWPMAIPNEWLGLGTVADCVCVSLCGAVERRTAHYRRCVPWRLSAGL